MTSERSLTQMQFKFVREYISNGCNGYQAAIKAGYSETYARIQTHQLINKPHIRERIIKAYERMNERQDKAIFMSLQERCKILNQIIYDIIPQDGSEPKRTHYKVALSAIAELNKMSGDYAPDKRLTLNVDATKDKLVEARRQYEEY